MITVDVHVVK